MVRLFVFIVLGVLAFQGCSRRRPEIKFPVEQQVKTEVILSDLRIRMAGSIFITDSLLIVQEPNTPEKYLKYYHLGRKELLAEFGQTGKGPGQMITPYLAYVDTHSSQVYLFDPNLRKMHVFDVAQLSEKPDTVMRLLV